MKSLAPAQRIFVFFALIVASFGNAASSTSFAATVGQQDSKSELDDKSETLLPKQIYQTMIKGTVWIHQKGKSGTGWVVDREKGLIMTNHHVVDQGEAVELYFAKFDENDDLITDAEEYLKYTRPIRAKVIDSDRRRDMAMIQVNQKLPRSVQSLTLAEKSATPADRLHVVGGRPETSNGVFIYANGYVREVSKGHGIFGGAKIWLIRHTVPTNRGNSGGALVNDAGQVVGVHNMGYRDANINNVAGGMDIREVKQYIKEVTSLYPAKDVKAYNRAGDRHYFNQRYHSAMDYYSAAIRSDLKNSAAFRMRGWCHYQMKNLDQATRDFSESIQWNAGEWEAYYGRGRVHEQRADTRKAIADYSEAIRLNPKAKFAYHQRGDVYRKARKYEESIRDYSKALELDPKFNVGFNQRGLTYLEMGKNQEAIQDFVSASKVVNMAIYSYNIGVAFERMGKTREAATAYVQATRIDRNYDRAWSSLGKLHLVAKDYDESIRHLNQAIRINPRSAYAYSTRARAYYAADKQNKALLDINSAISINNRIADYYAVRYDVLNKLGRSAEAQKDIQYAAKLDKQYAKFVSKQHVTARPTYSAPKGGNNSKVQGMWVYRGKHKGIQYNCAVEFYGNQFQYRLTWVDAVGQPGDISKSGTYVISGEREITFTTQGGHSKKHFAEFKKNGWLGITFDNIGMEIQFEKSK